MARREFITYLADFETTTDDPQSAQVWSASFKEYGTGKVQHKSNIADFIEYFYKDFKNDIIYLHNLKFDGSFIIDYLLRNGYKWHKTKPSLMSPKDFKAVISSSGLWYLIIIKKKGNKVIEIRDSLKLLPFSLAKISKDLNTTHKKKKMDFAGRGMDTEASEDDKIYIDEDVNVLEEGLSWMIERGLTEMTIGVCCYNDFINRTFKRPDAPYMYNPDFFEFFPDLTQSKIPHGIWHRLDKKIMNTSDDFCRSALKGGWCYLKKGMERKEIKGGITYDNNSLYTSQMHSSSGNAYPIGWPKWFTAREFEKIKKSDKIYFVRFRCYFKVKAGKLPFVQIKDSYLYSRTETLETSDVTLADGKKHKYYTTLDGNNQKARPWITMCRPDYELFLEQYEIEDLEINCGCYFRPMIGIFDKYINFWMGIKTETTGAKRTIAKLFLENIYGQLCRSNDSSYKMPYINASDEVSFRTIPEHNRKTFYIASGALVTAYGRRTEINAAQNNMEIFIYGDTDSLHLLDTKPVKDIKIHPTQQGAWKTETRWRRARFIRQKTYIEEITEKDGKELSDPEYLIKCSGMGEKVKERFIIGIKGEETIPQDMPESEKKHLYSDGRFIKRDFKDFDIGLELPGKLIAHRVRGGIRLEETTFKIRKKGEARDD